MCIAHDHEYGTPIMSVVNNCVYGIPKVSVVHVNVSYVYHNVFGVPTVSKCS